MTGMLTSNRIWRQFQKTVGMSDPDGKMWLKLSVPSGEPFICFWSSRKVSMTRSKIKGSLSKLKPLLTSWDVKRYKKDWEQLPDSASETRQWTQSWTAPLALEQLISWSGLRICLGSVPGYISLAVFCSHSTGKYPSGQKISLER